MKKVIFITATSLIVFSSKLVAQYVDYAAQFGRLTSNGGTARYLSMGGAGTTLGGDLGSAYVNPAGLGMYRKSEFSFSPNFAISSTSTGFLDESKRDNRGSFGFSNLGLAICNMKDDIVPGAWRGGTFSIGYTRTNSFQNRIRFVGVDDRNSMVDYFVEQANGTPQDEYDSNQNPFSSNSAGITSLGGLAYWAYLIEPFTSGGSQYGGFINDETVLKEASYTTRGSQSQWNLAYGANYKDKLYIGGGLGITGVNFREELNYTETVGFGLRGKSQNFEPSPDTLSNFTFDDNNRIRGTGVNLRLGYIYKINDYVRVGTTITTPGITWMNQNYSSDISATYPSNFLVGGTPLGTQSFSTVEGFFKFNYISPLRISQGLSLFAGKAGFLSVDVEYVPYQLSEFTPRSSTLDELDAATKVAIRRAFDNTNDFIRDSYKNVVNVRVGGEVRADIARFRAGFAYLPSPYIITDDINRDIYQISAGAGIRLENVYFDLGIINTRFNSTYTPYRLSNEDTATAITKNSLINAVFTMGFYFE